jgi:hypothetical protein
MKMKNAGLNIDRFVFDIRDDRLRHKEYAVGASGAHRA